MITALDTRGEVHISLLQANNNVSTMRIFFHSLVKKLDAADKNWYRTHVVMCDNASYHTCGAALCIFEELGVPLLFTGPHSFSASPIELFFAAFKAADINPRHLPVGKK
jgi:hypothetical protein